MFARLFLKFSALSGSYYISYCAIMGFSALFMQSHEFSNTEIGIFFSGSSVLCILEQLLCGTVLDHFTCLSAKHFLLTFSIISLLFSIPLLFTGQKTVILFCYIILGSSLLTNTSLLSSLAMEYINAGILFNFSLTRGIGSFSYACTSFILGILINRQSVALILPVFLFFQCVMIYILFHLRTQYQDIYLFTSKGSIPETSDSILSFFKRNPAVFLLLISILLIYFSYTAINNFHINIIEEAGGGSRELGISTAIGALAELPVMALFTPVSRKISYRLLFLFSCLFFFIKVVSLLFIHHIYGIYMSQFLQFFSYGLFIPASTYFINSVLRPSERMRGQSLLGIFTFGFSGLCSSLIGGVVLDRFGVKSMLTLFSLLAFIGLLGVFISCRYFRETDFTQN